MKRAASIAAMALLAGQVLVSCGGETGGGWSTDIREAESPTGERSLGQLEYKQIVETLKVTRDDINTSRPAGIGEFVTELKKDLTAKGIATKWVDTIDDTRIGKGIPGATTTPDSSGGSSGSSGAGDGTGAPPKIEAAKYFACPILAPENNSGTDCDKLVQGALNKVLTRITQQASSTQSATKSQNPDLPSEGQAFISAWSDEAQKHGAEIASIYALYELRAAGACDTKINALTVSYSLGREQGWQIVLSHRQWALAQVTTCAVNTDAIAAQVQTMSKGEVTEFMKKNTVCEDADLSSGNQVLTAAEDKRKEGINKGIDERAEVLRTELFQARQAAPCNTGGGGGEPLIIDLGDDGLEASRAPVGFDLLANGNKQTTTWIGPTDGLLAIDLDGNGAVDSGAELFGDQSDCGERRCYDGVAALARYDRKDSGGDGDGFITASDKVFESLLVWVDRNQDGVSQAAELSPLAAHGVRSIRLAATSRQLRSMSGLTVAAELEVLTQSGWTKAYDAWFQMQLKTADLRSFLPGR